MTNVWSYSSIPLMIKVMQKMFRLKYDVLIIFDDNLIFYFHVQSYFRSFLKMT